MSATVRAARPGPEVWRWIHSLELVFVDQCWTTCESFCCTTRHPDLRFRVIKPDQTFLPMLGTEFEYLRGIGRLQPGMEEHRHVLRMDLGEGRIPELVLARCAEKGLCFEPETRPLICKIYPFVPQVDDAGSIRGFRPGSVFDYVFRHAGKRSPCTVLEDRSAEVTPALREALAEICRIPYFIFYFAAFDVLARQLEESLARLLPSEVPAGDSPAFFRSFENLYLTGKLFDRRRLRTDLATIHERLEKKHGPFAI